MEKLGGKIGWKMGVEKVGLKIVWTIFLKKMDETFLCQKKSRLRSGWKNSVEN